MPRHGDRTLMRLFVLNEARRAIWAAGLNAVTAALGHSGRDSAALGIFFRFQVTDFDRLLAFFSLCHFIFPSYLFWVVSLRCVSDTKR